MKSTESQMKINPELPDKILLRGSPFNNSTVYISKEELLHLFREGWSLKDLVGYGTHQDEVSYLIEAKKLLDEIKEHLSDSRRSCEEEFCVRIQAFLENSQ